MSLDFPCFADFSLSCKSFLRIPGIFCCTLRHRYPDGKAYYYRQSGKPGNSSRWPPHCRPRRSSPPPTRFSLPSQGTSSFLAGLTDAVFSGVNSHGRPGSKFECSLRVREYFATVCRRGKPRVLPIAPKKWPFLAHTFCPMYFFFPPQKQNPPASLLKFLSRAATEINGYNLVLAILKKNAPNVLGGPFPA